MIVDVTVPEDLILTAEQLQMTMSSTVPKKEKEHKLRFRE